MFISNFLFDNYKQRLIVVKIDRIFVTFALLIQNNGSAKLHNIGAEVLFASAANTMLSVFSRLPFFSMHIQAAYARMVQAVDCQNNCSPPSGACRQVQPPVQ